MSPKILLLTSALTVGAVHFHDSPSVVIQPFSPFEITHNLVGWWRFEEGSGSDAADSSGLGNDASLISSPSWVTGKVGSYAISISGAQYVSVPDADSLTPSTGLTLAAWIYRDVDNGRDAIFCKHQSSGFEYGFGFYSNNLLYGWVYDNSASARIGRTAPDVNSGAWYHVAFTWDGSTSSSGIDLYVDGSVVDTGNYNAGNFVNVDNTTTALGIGISCPALGSSYFSGDIDDPRIYTAELSAAEIAALAEGR